jgi:hypothetical protein
MKNRFFHTKSNTYGQPLALVQLAKAQNRPTTAFQRVHRALDTICTIVASCVILVAVAILFAQATDPRPEFGTKACHNAQDKYFREHYDPAKHDLKPGDLAVLNEDVIELCK